MENKKDKRFINNLILYIISFQAVLTAIFFIIQVCRIYFVKHEYSRQIVGKSLLEILVVIILFIIVVIFGIIYFSINKIKDKNFTKVSNEYKIKMLLLKLDTTKIEEDDKYKKYLSNKKKNKYAWLINSFVLLICAFMSFCYLFNVDHFLSTGEFTNQIRSMVFNLLPFVVLGMISSTICLYYVEYNNKNSFNLLQALLKDNKRQDNDVEKNNKEVLIINIIRGVVLVIAVVLIIQGIFIDGNDSVLAKASAICTECIGLG